MSDATTPAGWYPSPNEPGAERYFDGQQWTDQRRPVQAIAGDAEPSGKPWYLRWWALGLWGFVGLMILGAIGAAVAPPEDEGDADNPVPAGQAAQVTLDARGDADESAWSITVTGPAYNGSPEIDKQPDDGNIFVLVPVRLTLDEAGKEPLGLANNLELELVTGSDFQQAPGCGRVPRESELDEDQDIFIGGSLEGTICTELSAEELADGLLLTTISGVDGPVFLEVEGAADIEIAAPVPETTTTEAEEVAQVEEETTTTVETTTTTEAETTTTTEPPDLTELLAEEISDDFDRVDSVEFFENTGVLRVEGFLETPPFLVGIGVQDELSDIVQDASKTEIDFESFDVQLKMELVDQLGNVEEEIVLNISWDAETVRAINWDNFDQANIVRVGEATFIHPALQGEL